jgi:HD superfamily phosphohydrolase
VCADLLDYLARDYHYLGIRRSYDERIYHYFTVEVCEDGKPHFIVKLTEEGRHAEDSLTEIDNLLRIRYTLAERVQYHHTKLAADAMLDKAVTICDTAQQRAVADCCGDEVFLDHLERQRDRHGDAAELASLLRNRRLYKPAYIVPYSKRGKRPAKWHPYMDPSGRRREERSIATAADKIAGTQGQQVSPHQVAIFCPEWEMNLKEAEVLVHDTGRHVEELMVHPGSQAGSINEQHKALWKFYVYSAEEVLPHVHQACVERFGEQI